ncbi:MAG TPA: HAD family acid phosphatase [Gemmatimonadales bacterium]|nr:HAD family acid phosphatase [Gemmatimonadales bacterium]
MPPRPSPASLRARLGFLALLGLAPGLAGAQTPGQGLQVKYVRDSEEYAVLARQVFRVATNALPGALHALPRGAAWAVVLDVDETALDNSVYELERATYGIPFNDPSWSAWVERREAGAVPGVEDFIRSVRAAGGRVAWISNRDESTREATRANLDVHGLWADADLLCLQRAADSAYTKRRRRGELEAGAGSCSWPGVRPRVIAFVGDAMGDFPSAEEAIAAGGPTGEQAFGSRHFLLPNPMYGRWATRVTRRPAPGRVGPGDDSAQD